eukprot:GILK01015679.1.p1 GENE.GILK01015679.1~~GILK01015679.1.p1  ORF type:complete len:310 (+),score=8.57 GILK01015679.1:10-939(+)
MDRHYATTDAFGEGFPVLSKHVDPTAADPEVHSLPAPVPVTSSSNTAAKGQALLAKAMARFKLMQSSMVCIHAVGVDSSPLNSDLYVLLICTVTHCYIVDIATLGAAAFLDDGLGPIGPKEPADLQTFSSSDPIASASASGNFLMQAGDAAAFGLEPRGGHLRALLESHDITKVTYDCRPDVEVLSRCFGVRLNGICDLQVMATMAISPRGSFMIGRKAMYQRLFLPGESDEVRKEQVNRTGVSSNPLVYPNVAHFPSSAIEVAVIRIKYYYMAFFMLSSSEEDGRTIAEGRARRTLGGTYDKSSKRDF